MRDQNARLAIFRGSSQDPSLFRPRRPLLVLGQPAVALLEVPTGEALAAVRRAGTDVRYEYPSIHLRTLQHKVGTESQRAQKHVQAGSEFAA